MAEQPKPERVKQRDPISDNAPWRPAPYEIEHVGAIQALMNGKAEPHQQKLALEYIVNVAAGTYEAHYHTGPDGLRNTAFALGRAFVGQTIVKLTKLNIAHLKQRRDRNG